ESTRQKAVQTGFDLYNAAHGTSWQTVETYFIIKLPIQILKDGGKSDVAAIYGRQAHWRAHFSALDAPDGIYIDDYGGRQMTQSHSAVDFGGVVISLPELQSTFGDYHQIPKKNGNFDAQESLAWKN